MKLEDLKKKIKNKQKLTKEEKEAYVFMEYDVDLRNCFKHRYMIAFYDYEDNFISEFENIGQIAAYMDINPNTKGYNTLKSRISNCLKKNCPLNTRYIVMDDISVRPYLIDLLEDIDQEVLL